jgi:bifunctional non-homologous end joining protein LigD
MGEGWIHELKWDGYRVIVRRNEGVVRLWSRHGRNWDKEFPRIVEAVRALPFENFTLDGEAVCLLEDGHPDFHALRSKHTCQDAVLVAFDLLGMDGADLRSLPLHERRRRLAAVLSAGPDALLFSSHVEAGQGEALFRRACAMNLEGIVSKRLEAPYRSGLSQTWRKIKCLEYRRP